MSTRLEAVPRVGGPLVALLAFSLALLLGPAQGAHAQPAGDVHTVVARDAEAMAGWLTSKVGSFLVVFAREELRSPAEGYGRLAGRVYAQTGAELPHPMLGEMSLVVADTPRVFARITGIAELRTPAAAGGHPPTVFLNLEVLRAFPPSDVERILAHEFAHVFIARHVEGRVPLWLEEGIAMRVAGERADDLFLIAARLRGGLPRLRDLNDRFPPTGDARSLAYQMARSVVDFLIGENHPVEGLPGLLRDLADDVTGPDLVERYAALVMVDNIERSWLERVRVTVLVLRLLSDETVQWILIAGLAGVAWVVLRVRRRRRLRAMEEADAAALVRPLFDGGTAPVWQAEESAPPAPMVSPPDVRSPGDASPDAPPRP